MAHVFISYSRHDTEFVEKLERDLIASGTTVWRDVMSIPGGADWYASIVRSLHQVDAAVLVVTPHSDQSRWVLREALYADHNGIPILPVFPAEYRARLQLEFLLINLNPIACSDYTAGLASLQSALAKLPLRAKAAEPTAEVLLSDREAEQAYLDLLISEIQYDLDTRHYVSLMATSEATTREPARPRQLSRKQAALGQLGIEVEQVHGDAFDQPGEAVEDARALIQSKQRVMLLGDPGSGKTTTLQQLAVDMAEAAKRDPTKPLPVFISLPGFLGEGTFSKYVCGQMKLLEDQYERLLSDGRLFLLCDALNEMQREANGRMLVTEVRDYLHDRPAWTASCRVRDYREELAALPDVTKVRLKPLDPPRIHQFIQHRFHDDPDRARQLWADLRGSDDLLAAWKAFVAVDKAEAFWAGDWPRGIEMDYNIRHAWRNMQHDKRRMMQLCRNPYMLWMVYELFNADGTLPDNRGDLFRRFVNALLAREEAISLETGADWIAIAIIRRVLAQVAYAMQRSETGTEITRTEAERILAEQPDIRDPALLLRLASAASLLEVGESVRYTHQLLQEYFSSEVMGGAMDSAQSPTQFWPPENWWEPQGWEETAIILAGVRADPEAVARWIAPAQPEVAYRALTESGIEINIDTIDPGIRAVLVENAHTKTTEPNPLGRAAAYRVLGVFDADERPGVGLRDDRLPDIDWVEVPAGKFIFQISERLHLDTFYMARYPVTYIQFQAFIEAGDGFHNPHWWDGLAADENHKRAPGEQISKYSNHPCERVSWWDAVAFCRWLSTRLEYDITLPTEQQWEKAARGTDGREFPWGDEYIPGCANINETDGDAGPHYVQQTTAVGIYPQGASPYGLLDLSGNVWEWCLNEPRNPANTDLVGDAARVLRGGSWSLSILGAGCIYRNWEWPHYRDDNIGFRVVCATPTP